MLKKVFSPFSLNKFLFLLIPLIFIGIATRFVWLDKIPVGITHDDTDVILSAKSYWEIGKDISGTTFPQSLFFNNTAGNISGLPSLLLAPFIGPFKLSLFYTHLLYVLINVLTLVFISLLSFYFYRNFKLAVFIFLAGLFNPWMFVYSRYPTEAPFALLFAVIAIYVMFRKQAFNILLSTLFFILSFYSYFGAKVVIPLLFLPVLLIRFFEKGKDFVNLKTYIFSLCLFVLLIGGYFFVVLSSSSGTFNRRAAGEFIFSNINSYQNSVNEIRRASIDFPFKNLFFNKYTLVFKDVASKYFGWVNSDFLFVFGDPISVYRFGEHGLFYFMDVIFVLSGFFWLFVRRNAKFRYVSLLLLTLVVVAPIGSSISIMGTSYFFRAFLLIPVGVMIIGYGMYYLYTNILKIKYYLLFILLFLLYLLFFINFLVFYFFRYPVKQQDNQFLEERILASYLTRAKNKGLTVGVDVANTISSYNLYTFYSGSLDRKFIPHFEGSIGINLTGIKFTDNCKADAASEIQIYDIKLNCPKEKDRYVVIQNQKDAGYQYYIYNDKVCENEKLDVYRRTHELRDYAVENLTDAQFCNKWIFKGIN